MAVVRRNPAQCNASKWYAGMPSWLFKELGLVLPLVLALASQFSWNWSHPWLTQGKLRELEERMMTCELNLQHGVQACTALEGGLFGLDVHALQHDMISLYAGFTDHLIKGAERNLANGSDDVAVKFAELAKKVTVKFSYQFPVELQSRMDNLQSSFWSTSMSFLDGLTKALSQVNVERPTSAKAVILMESLRVHFQLVWPSFNSSTKDADLTDRAIQLARNVTDVLQKQLMTIAQHVGSMDAEALNLANERLVSFAHTMGEWLAELANALHALHGVGHGAEVELAETREALGQATDVEGHSQHMIACLAELREPPQPSAKACKRLVEHLEVVRSMPSLYTSFVDNLVIEAEGKLLTGEDLVAMEFMDFSSVLVGKFSHHLSPESNARAKDVTKQVWDKSITMLRALTQAITDGRISAEELGHKEKLTFHMLYLWPRLLGNPGIAVAFRQSLQDAITSLAQQLKSKVQQLVQAVENPCKKMRLDAVVSKLESVRAFAWHMEGWFGTLADTILGMPQLQVAHPTVREAIEAMQQAFGTESQKSGIAKAFSWLGAHPQSCIPAEVDALLQKALKRTSLFGLVGCTFQLSPSCECRTRAHEQLNQSADFLKVPRAVEKYEAHVDSLLSPLVRTCFDEQLEIAQRYLEKGAFDEIKKMLLTWSNWQGLVGVKPPLDVERRKEDVLDKIRHYAKRQERDAVRHFDSKAYKSMESSIEKLAAIRDWFEDSSVELALEEVNEKISKRIRDIHADGMRTLQSVSVDDPQIGEFANSLVLLGTMWVELLKFKPLAEQALKQLLDVCAYQLDPSLIILVGRYLMKMQEAEGGAPNDGTMSPATVALQLLHAFGHFKVVQNVAWNRATEKMQKDPETCVRELRVKSLDDDSAKVLDYEDLLKGLRKFYEHYDVYQQQFLDGKLQKEDVISNFKAEVKKIEKEQQSWFSALGLVDTQIDIASLKDRVPTLLAHVFMHYTIVTSGNPKFSNMSDALAADSIRNGLRTPHNIQVLAILRFFGYGEVNASRLVNQLAQVRTGEGKSLILGSSAVIFASLGFKVRCVSYSAFLSRRDWREFEATFNDFGVGSRIKYSTITMYAEDAIAERGDPRAGTEALLLGNKLQQPSELTKQTKEVLLIDEVDVLFGPDFYGKTHDPMASIQHPSARALLEYLWSRREEVESLGSCRKILGEARNRDCYSDLRSRLPGFEFVLKSQVSIMCNDLHKYLHGDAPRAIFDRGDGGRIGYEHLDRVDFSIVHGYMTSFAYLDNLDKLVEGGKDLNQVLTLLVPSGQFAYSNINPYLAFGVSGTIGQLGENHRKELTKYKFWNFTILPSVYGTSKFRFLEQPDAIRVCDEADHHQQIALAIKDKVVQEKRAILVFFKSIAHVRSFEQSTFSSKIGPYSVLEERLTHEEKEHLIKKAGTMGMIVLATAIFGRGSDFVSYDDRLDQNGGLHVLQTFPSSDVSEEVQMWGRTARQGKKGSYSLIITNQDVGALPDMSFKMIQDGQSKFYESLSQSRTQLQQKALEQMQGSQKEAMLRDEATQAYFSPLLAGHRAAAAASFQTFYKNALRSSRAVSQASSVHYIVCLDRSGSMSGTPWKLVKEASINFVDVAADRATGSQSVVSLVLFNSDSRVSLMRSPLQQKETFANAIQYAGGGTDFGKPLTDAFNLIQESRTDYQRHCVLFYTDGQAPFPHGAVSRLRSLAPDDICFFAITQDAGEVLHEIAKQLYPATEAAAHVLSNVQPAQVAGKMVETLDSMNMGYVRQQ